MTWVLKFIVWSIVTAAVRRELLPKWASIPWAPSKQLFSINFISKNHLLAPNSSVFRNDVNLEALLEAHEAKSWALPDVTHPVAHSLVFPHLIRNWCQDFSTHIYHTWNLHLELHLLLWQPWKWKLYHAKTVEIINPSLNSPVSLW